jgi:hypothetical protein
MCPQLLLEVALPVLVVQLPQLASQLFLVLKIPY